MKKEFQVQISLYEVLVKTAYQTQITEPDDKICGSPVSFGSGFIVTYDNDDFFVTADHTVHLDDYKRGEREGRVWKDYVVSIFNNFTPPENFLSTVVTPLGGFYYMEQFQVNKPFDIPKPVDVSVCKMKETHFTYPFLTDEVRFANNELVKAGESKLKIPKECFSEPVLEKDYFVFGKIRTKIIDNIRLYRENTLKECLRFVSKSGDYLLFKTLEIVVDEEDWAGLSGSPVISEEGECVGVLCDVLKNSHSIWVMPISKVKLLMDVAIQQEKIEDLK